jgi:uncharacterized membrane protein YphA (DoxX/SURF4 family)
MKIIVTISRILTGLLFIFSGLIKAIDPRGLAYKMEEFFEAWANSGFMKSTMESLGHYSLFFSVAMITLEVVVGVALLIGWQKRLSTWILFLLMMFFTFLTSYVLFSGKIRSCGCFGDCVPLTPIQTFTKDIILLLLTILLLIRMRDIKPLFSSPVRTVIVLAAALATVYLQFYVMKHLPLMDCLPFKKGNNIAELRKMPIDAIPDKYDYVFVYEKDGQVKDFPVSALPDSTWKFKERKQTLVQKGKNNIPKINDFSLTDEDGNNVTESILNEPGNYYLLFMKEVPDHTDSWLSELKRIADEKKAAGKHVYIVTATPVEVKRLLENSAIQYEGLLTCDATAIKTAARTNPALFEMDGPVVKDKWGWADFDKVK